MESNQTLVSFLSDLIPFVLEEEKCHIRQEIGTKDVSVIFDGTCHLGEALAVVLRLVDDDFSSGTYATACKKP